MDDSAGEEAASTLNMYHFAAQVFSKHKLGLQ